jgi:hypothetical protein
VCPHHHDDITHRGATLTGSHQTGWTWRPPPHHRARSTDTRHSRDRAP